MVSRAARCCGRTSDTSDARSRPESAASAGQTAGRDVISSRNDANSVSVDEEMSLMAETQLRYQALTQTVGTRMSTLRSVIRGQ